MQIHDIPRWMNMVYFGGALALAMGRGDWALRLAASVILAPWIVYIGAWYLEEIHLNNKLFWRSWQIGQFMVCLWLIAVRPRWWTVWAAAASLLILVLYPTLWLAPGISQWAQASVQLVWYYIAATAIVTGALTTPRRPRSTTT